MVNPIIVLYLSEVISLGDNLILNFFSRSKLNFKISDESRWPESKKLNSLKFFFIFLLIGLNLFNNKYIFCVILDLIIYKTRLMISNLSIIIPFYNAEKFINKNFYSCLKILKNINAEVIYVDNLSNDNSYIKIKKKIKNYKNFSIFKIPKKFKNSPGIARNIGIKNENLKNIIFLDIDDELVINNPKKFNNYIKKNKSNIIFIKKKIIKKNKSLVDEKSPFIKFNKYNLSVFFSKSINMAVISIIFNKNFILKKKIFFQKGIYEDILFIFKAHYYNEKKIGFLDSIIYKKNLHSNSITNSKLSINHLRYMFLAWKNINEFLKKKLNKKEYNKVKTAIQFRLRGEFANEYNKIINSNIKQPKRKQFINFIVNKYKSVIIPGFKVLTKKDKIAQSVLKI